VAVNLIAAAGVGVALSVLLFLREQVRGSVVRRKFLGNQMFSRKRRIKAEMAILDQHGPETVVFELQGPLFFGTTDQLFSELEPHLGVRRYFILDLKRVRSLDFTAAHLLNQIQSRIAERGGCLLLSDLPPNHLPVSGLLRPTIDDALEWVEDRILEQHLPESAGLTNHKPLPLGQIDVLSGLPAEALDALAGLAVERSFAPGEHIFKQGDSGDELHLIRRGTVRIVLPMNGSRAHHLVSFKRGDFFGDMSFLDRGARSADAVASTAVDLYSISRKTLDDAVARYPKLGELLFSRLAHVLALRLRQTDRELRALEEA
jgi:SulP family sulfate permease